MGKASATHRGNPVVYLLISAFICFALVPIVWMLWISIRSAANAFDFTLESKAFHFMNYPTVFRAFYVYFGNSLKVAVTSTALSVILALLAGYGFSRFRFRHKQTLLNYVLLGRMFPPILLALGFFAVIQKIGLYDNLSSVILMDTIYTLPFSVWMIKNYFDAIPHELDEAAMIDGCGRTSVMVRIILPVSLPGVMATAVYCFLLSWNEFLYALTFILSEEKRVVTVAMGDLIGEWGTNYPELMALSALVSVPLMIVFMVVQKFLIQGLAAGSVKE